MSLESGKYTITSKLDGAPIGRRLAEPLDTRPKGIFKLPQDMASSDHATIWEVEKLENGNHTLKANRNIVGDINEQVFAILFEEQIGGAITTEWTIDRDIREKEVDAYVVLAPGDRWVGWVAPESDNEQILIKPIITGKSFPPYYPPREVFVFKKAD